jgi:hypothetical protein
LQLGLPLLQPAQAQKHVTVNEALARLDGLTMLILQSRSLTTQPGVAVEGSVWAVPPGGVNEWSGQDGRLALAGNGGWDFVVPKRGWRSFILDEGMPALFDGAAWREGAVTLTVHNAGLAIKAAQIDHVVTAGPQSVTSDIIPANACVIGATARVVSTITGTLTGWELGNPGAAGRYGSGLGLTVGSFARGLLGQPTAFYSATAMQLDAIGGNFSGGTVRIAVHYLELALPD